MEEKNYSIILSSKTKVDFPKTNLESSNFIIFLIKYLTNFKIPIANFNFYAFFKRFIYKN
jgi:hypothetical protein